MTDWFNSSTKDIRVLAFSFDGKYSENAIYQKLLELGFIQEDENRREHISSFFTSGSTSTKLQLPDAYPSVEEVLKTFIGIRNITNFGSNYSSKSDHITVFPFCSELSIFRLICVAVELLFSD